MSEYQEALRPQCHFTTKKYWINDPNGLVYYKGVYHLFYQYAPGYMTHGPKYWGHSVSSDLVHWKELEPAIAPDDYADIWSGSAVVDWNNTSGFGVDGQPPLVAFYTTGRDFSEGKNPCVQGLAYSTDEGATWTKYEKNPILPHIVANNRDPKVIWDSARSQWVMVLYLDVNDFAFFTSQNLIDWTELSRFEIPHEAECPDFFQLPLDGDPNNLKWVLTAASRKYQVGDFDGKNFIPETDVMVWDTGRNTYAAQSWSDLPDNRRVHIAWFDGGAYPDMPFTQQMNFPCELTLKTTPEGIRLCRQPVKEIESLYKNTLEIKDATVNWVTRGFAPWATDPVDAMDLEMEIDLEGDGGFDILIREEALRYFADEEQLVGHGTAMKLYQRGGRVKLRILMDRTSWEIFGGDGETSMSSCLLPHPKACGMSMIPHTKGVKLVSSVRHDLKSAWE